MSLLAGIHPVREALRAGRPLERVLIVKGAAGPRLQEVVELCRERGVPVRFESREQLDRAAAGAPHQGCGRVRGSGEILVSRRDFCRRRLARGARWRRGPTTNLGAIVRTAYAAGAAAVVIPERRAAGLTDVVSRSAAGALAYLPVVRVANINRALEDLKKTGYWIYGLDQRGTVSYDQVEYTRPTALVLGGEGHGLHQNVARHCDFLVSIPMAGGASEGSRR